MFKSLRNGFFFVFTANKIYSKAPFFQNNFKIRLVSRHILQKYLASYPQNRITVSFRAMEHCYENNYKTIIYLYLIARTRPKI